MGGVRSASRRHICSPPVQVLPAVEQAAPEVLLDGPGVHLQGHRRRADGLVFACDEIQDLARLGVERVGPDGQALAADVALGQAVAQLLQLVPRRDDVKL